MHGDGLAPDGNLVIAEKCTGEMHSISEGRFGEAEPEGCASICGRGRSQAPTATGG